MPNTSRAPPILDFSAFYGSDPVARQNLVDQVRNCCLHNGFFQITGHPIPTDLQEKILSWSEKFFNLSVEEKSKVSKDLNTWNRGYELLRSQILEEGTNPELKEGYYIGEEIPTTHPYFVQKKLNSGPNNWPESMPDVDEFKRVAMDYYHAVFKLATDILKVLALTLDLPESFFDKFAHGAVATMRLLHYPPQPADAEEKLTRGIGAHTDFGAITLLMQDKVDGLQVWDADVKQWFDVMPIKGAYVVNLGNLFMKWSNDRYKSNIHRVINKSGRERYSVPFFFSGNPDYTIDCLPNCCAKGEKPKYAPVTVEEAVSASYKESYGRAEKYKQTAATKESPLKVSESPSVQVR